MVQWLSYGVLLSVLPLITDGLLGPEGEGFSLENLIGDGQLLLTTSGIACGATGVVVMSEAESRVRGFFTALNLAGVAIVSVLYARFHLSRGTRDHPHAVELSLILFGVVVGLSIVAVALARSTGDGA
jgi:uncharacterized transporter YbjL